MNRPPVLRLHDDELIIDSFAGGGGASLGIEWALGRSPHKAINHDKGALAMHAANHPLTEHILGNVWDQKPREVCGDRRVALAWWSPDCTHHSNARGGKPRDKNIRGLADVAITWAREVRPRVNVIENVREFATWGPLDERGHPIPNLKGMEFRRWWREWEELGYRVEMRRLRACDYGAPTSRERLFIIARCDGDPIAWPEPTHGPGLLPYRTAADCIDWSLPCPSIFMSKEEGKLWNVRRPLVEATLRRIGTGTWRYVINNAQPFILPLTNHDRSNRSRGIDELLPTITSANRGELAMVAPTLVQTGYGERQGQAPRCLDIEAPLGTVVGGGQKHALVAAFLAKHYGGGPNGNQSGGAQGAVRPMGTITSQDHHALVASSLVKLKGTCADGQPMTVPLGTVAAQGTHFAEVRAFLIKYYGSDQDPRLEEPLHTITSKDRFGLVTVHGEEYVIADIGMRMLVARELFTAQGFPQSYIIDPVVDGKPLGKTEQVEKVGNSVCPPLAAAIVRANFADVAAARVAL